MLSGKAGKLHVLGQHHFSLMVPMLQSSSVCLCRWKVDGRDINTDSDLNYSLVEGNLLISNPHVINHGGVYQCIATNTFGTVVSREAKVQFACELILLFFKYAYCNSSEKKSHSPTPLWLGVILCVTQRNAKQLEWGCDRWLIPFISIIISLVNHLIYLVFKMSGDGEKSQNTIFYSSGQMSKPQKYSVFCSGQEHDTGQR